MYYKDQNKLSEKEWMESVMNQMGFKTTNESQERYMATPKRDPMSRLYQYAYDIKRTFEKSKNTMPTDGYTLAILQDDIKGMFELLPTIKIKIEKTKQEINSSQRQQSNSQMSGMFDAKKEKPSISKPTLNVKTLDYNDEPHHSVKPYDTTAWQDWE